jgi:hypothetical protein
MARSRSVIFLLPGCLLLAACATYGWHGDHATPFDTARKNCDALAAAQSAGQARDATFDACMNGEGWQRR